MCYYTDEMQGVYLGIPGKQIGDAKIRRYCMEIFVYSFLLYLSIHLYLCVQGHRTECSCRVLRRYNDHKRKGEFSNLDFPLKSGGGEWSIMESQCFYVL